MEKKKKNCGTNLSQSFPCFSNLLPGIGEQWNIKVWFWEFSTHSGIYLCVKNYQSYICSHSCLPIPGRLFYNGRTIHGPRIWECNVPICMQTYSIITKDNQNTQKYLYMYVYQNKTRQKYHRIPPTHHNIQLHIPAWLNITQHTQNDFNIQNHTNNYPFIPNHSN